MNNSYCVYLHISPSNKYYVGITRQSPENRWCNGNGYKTNQHFYNAIKKYGWNNFGHLILDDNCTVEDAKKLEKEYVKYYKSDNSKFGYNKTAGGDSTYPMTNETKEKMSNAKKGLYSGAKNWCYGKSPRIRMSKEVYEKWRFSKAHDNTKRKIVCLETKEIFDSITDAANKYNIQISDIVSCCKGRLCTAGNMKWQYYEDYLNGISVRENSWFVKIICLNTLERFDKIVDASKKYNVPASNITLCCQRKYSSAGKCPTTKEPLVWQYLNDYINGVRPKELLKSGISVQCLNTGEIFQTIREAARHYNTDAHGIKCCCDGIRISSGKHPITKEKLKWDYN